MHGNSNRMLVLSLLALFVAGPLAAQEAAASEEQIAEGKALFLGDGGCHMCHGQDAKGIAGMTNDLTDGEWNMVEEGTLEAIKEVIKNGLGAEKTGGIPMQAQGERLTEDQITALAAYLLSLGP